MMSIRNLSVCSVFLMLGLFCLTSYAEPKPPISADKAKWMGYVEDFFMNNYRDITLRKSLAWGDPTTDDKGNVSITYKYDALIWGKERIIIEDQFTFEKDGKFVEVKKLSKETVKTAKVVETPETKAADKFLAETAAGNYEKAIALCDETMKKAMSVDMLKKIWTDLTTQFGKSIGIEAVKTENFLGHVRVHEECGFEMGRAVLMVAVDKDLNVSGLFLMSSEKGEELVKKPADGNPDPAASRKKSQEQWGNRDYIP